VTDVKEDIKTIRREDIKKQVHQMEQLDQSQKVVLSDFLVQFLGKVREKEAPQDQQFSAWGALQVAWRKSHLQGRQQLTFCMVRVVLLLIKATWTWCPTFPSLHIALEQLCMLIAWG
jgi:hypothetical protein